jgi:hypothetical protein
VTALSRDLLDAEFLAEVGRTISSAFLDTRFAKEPGPRIFDNAFAYDQWNVDGGATVTFEFVADSARIRKVQTKRASTSPRSSLSRCS